jgi:hypothetical protein
MAQDYYAILGLRPGQYCPSDITCCFMDRRAQLLKALADPLRHTESRRRLEELHLAYAVLRDPARQAAYLRTRDLEGDAVGELRALIAASLESGLMRHSRRQAILERAGELGLNEFQAHLLIAQVQFGDEEIQPMPRLVWPSERQANPRAWARLAGVGVLALTMFLGLIQWLRG